MSQVLSGIVGGKWWKVDFHLHTPAPHDYGHGDETAKSITAKQLIDGKRQFAMNKCHRLEKESLN